MFVVLVRDLVVRGGVRTSVAESSFHQMGHEIRSNRGGCYGFSVIGSRISTQA